MMKSRVGVCLFVMVGLLAVSIPAPAQVNGNGFSFGQTFVLSKVDDNGRILLTLFGFFASGPGAMLIDVKCPLTQPGDPVAAACNDLIEVGSELQATTGLPPDPFSDYPTRYELRSITIGTPVIVSLEEGSAVDLRESGGRSFDAPGITRPELFGELRSVVAA